MATCKDCIWYDILCQHTLQDDELKMCESFKNKADFVEVKHGEWIKRVVEKHGIYRPTFICSKCGKRRFVLANYNFCPNCGAKMDGGKG